jgi:cytidyltransferase-like protein
MSLPRADVRAGRAEKLIPFEELGKLRTACAGSRIVHCHGVFDVLHSGHLAYFESAKQFGDVLVVTVTADKHVNKGPGHPFFTAAVRANMIAALQIADFVSISDYPNAVPAIVELKPDFYVKGPDYADKSKDATGGILLEEQAVKRAGGRLVFTSDTAYSSTELLNRFFKLRSDRQLATIEQVNKAGGMKMIEEVLERLSHETVLVVGEPIIDTYVFCNPESISSKSPSISAKYVSRENYAGGSLAIANHLADFAKKVILLTAHGGEDFFLALLAEKLDPRIDFVDRTLPGVPTPQKTRFIEQHRLQRIFELTNLRVDQWIKHPKEAEGFRALLAAQEKRAQMAIVADFGHGLFEGPVLSALPELNCFLGLNVQTNSSNYAFNPYTKHKRFSFLSIDTKEARLACHDQFTPPLELARNIQRSIGSFAGLAMTRGPDGSFFIPKGSSLEYDTPAFDDSVVDPIGAGDAFFAMTAVLTKVGCPDVIIPFLGNVFAGLKTRILGNKTSVTRAALLKAAASILR